MTHKQKFKSIINLSGFMNIKLKKREVVKLRVENNLDESDSDKENAVRIFNFQGEQLMK